ncbi:MAG: hypothetical protein K0Q57_310 [Gammaproteobacteria bacterium]|jgi:RNA:NAD 2'-phosphotransferase (TPT1/KptA family)|nr:hypothetical protein [Gammaproteobacteria bacterium]
MLGVEVMARTLAKIVHDVKPPIETVDELVHILSVISEHLPEKKAIEQLREGLSKLNDLTKTMKAYIKELEAEVNHESMTK